MAVGASFRPAAYLLELLETAADENQTAYFPLLDRVAEGYFSDARTDEELYQAFLRVLHDDGHIADTETLSSFRFALSLHSAAPRIEAHHQFYNTSVGPTLTKLDTDCHTWVHFHRRRYCSPFLYEFDQNKLDQRDVRELRFDRVLSLHADLPASILYADILHPSFGHFHKILIKSARQGKTSYRIRYRPLSNNGRDTLLVNGYGVELSLKKTDYIVIDDRDEESQSQGQKPKSSDAAGAADDDKTELKPLSKSEVAQLGLKSASFILQQPEPFKALFEVTQDFPLHSSRIVAHKSSGKILKELEDDRTMKIPMGYNGFWINGIQLDARQIDAHALLHHLRRERRLVNQLKDFGFSGLEAVKLLTQTAIAKSTSTSGPQRYDFRDSIEGGNVILWMNDLENDRRYEGWPSSLASLLQRMYPGQLPPVRRDIHNMVVPIDFTDSEDLRLVVDTIQGFVRRSIPIRFGLLPLLSTDDAAGQARVVYHLLRTYGVPSMLSYLESCIKPMRCGKPDQPSFDHAIGNRQPLKDLEKKELQDVLNSDESEAGLSGAKAYSARLGLVKTSPSVLINGAALPRGDEWLSAVINRVGQDLRTLQEAVFEGAFEEDTWLPSHFLSDALRRRNTLVVPEDEGELHFVDLNLVYSKHGDRIKRLPRWTFRDTFVKEDWVQFFVIADYSTPSGSGLLTEVLRLFEEDAHAEVVFLHNPAESSEKPGIDRSFNEKHTDSPVMPDSLRAKMNETEFSESWQSLRSLVDMFGVKPGENALVSNGRVIGPIPSTAAFDQEDLQQLLNYERSIRMKPLCTALKNLAMDEKIQDYATAARLVSVISISSKPDTPEGIFEAASTSRVEFFEEWQSAHSMLAIGDPTSALIQIVVSLDPASETAQRWVPILKVLSELSGIYIRIFMNPRESLQELPIKRFYRHVLQSRPSFGRDGAVQGLSARFSGATEGALMTIGLDVPPAWLVTPKESIHDLDNIKLSSANAGTDVYALYELEHILIEGHARDMNTGSPPRGVQLTLGTVSDPHVTDTIVMANLGYFQFKANPGLWNVDLLPGRNREVFSIDSAGPKGYIAQTGDETTAVELLSFQGKTLFPRLSRKAGHETDDVLEMAPSPADSMVSYLSKGVAQAQVALSKIGIRIPRKHADINIFSVASGHLYERMLNIMMVSVMKHTKHTVKFWFIEQFLSPSFKDSIPLLAEEYGFEYEMVTYKWPHWLRGQREKQREIWGYKILFLDVLFPLSLSKVIFVDADQIVRTDMYGLVKHDLRGAVYGFTPMCDSRTEMEGFRFWKQGYWKNYLRGLPYHISALYVVDLQKFRQVAAGDRLRQQYHQLAADPNSLSNLDQDLPNHMQHALPIHSLPQEWLWCETWCSDEDLTRARTIDLCNNPLTKEPKLDRARRQVPEWTVYDDEIRDVIRRRREGRAPTTSPLPGSSSKPSSSDKEEL